MTSRFELRGSRVLLTGASRGLGAVLAVGLAREGAELVLSARDSAKLEAVASECQRLGASVQIVPADVSRADERSKLASRSGAIDVLVNNAGVEIPRAVLDQSGEDVASQITTNLVAPIELTRLILPGMVQRKRGVIVNVSSMSGKSPTPYNAIYAAAKHGINGFTASLRLELEGTGVHAGVVCPSFVADAGMWADTGLKAPAAMREVKPERFVRAVFAVIAGAGEVLVTPGPVRPLLALGQMAPSLDGALLRTLGVMPVLKARASGFRR